MNPLKTIKIVFTCIGALLLSITGAIVYYNISFANNSYTTKGEVVALRKSSEGTGYAPTVVYSVANKKYTVYGSLYSTPPAFGVGEKVDVLYKKDNYFDAKIKSFSAMWVPALIVGSLGFVFFVIGVAIIIYSIPSSRKRNYLKRDGKRIVTEFIKVEKNKVIEVNGAYPYRIISQWLNTKNNKVYVFKSDNLWFNPKEFIRENEITVYIKRGNPKKYYMDISFLPELAN